jgi:hypothetical protein
MKQTNTPSLFFFFFWDAHHKSAQSSHYPLDPSINFTPQFSKDNTHMWQRRRSPADHCYGAPLTPPYPSEIRKEGKEKKQKATQHCVLLHPPPPTPQSRSRDKEKEKRIKEYA